jgi:hypothetical protein
MASAVSSASLFQTQQAYFQQRKTDLQQLGQALQSGDLAGAQQAYNAIVSLSQNGPAPGSAPFVKSDRQAAFAAIGQALQSGDLGGAQQAFAQLQNTFSFHHRLRAQDPTGGAAIVNISPSGNASSSSSSATNSAAVAGNLSAGGLPEVVLNVNGASGNGERITINLSNGSSGGEHLTIGFGNSQGSNAEQINLNLPQNTQILLNLFRPNSGSSSSNGVSVSA